MSGFPPPPPPRHDDRPPYAFVATSSASRPPHAPPVLPSFAYLPPTPAHAHLTGATDRLRPPDYLHRPPYRHPSVGGEMASTDASPGADNYDQMQADAYEDEGSGTPGSRKLKNTKRAAQNRAAQRAFRERKDRYVRELEARSAQLDDLLRRQARLEERERLVAEREQALGIAPSYPLPSPEDDVKPTFAVAADAVSHPEHQRPPVSPVAPITPPPSAAASARPSVKLEQAYVQPRPPPPSSSGSSSSRPSGSGPSVLLHRPPLPQSMSSGPTAEERLQALESELDVVRMQIRHQAPQVSDAPMVDERSFATRPPLPSASSRPSLPSLPSLRYPSFATRPAHPPYLESSSHHPHPGRPTFDSQPPQVRQLPPLAPAPFGSPHPNSSERMAGGPSPHPHTLPPISSAFPPPPPAARYPSPTSSKRASVGYGDEQPRLKKQRSVGPETPDQREEHHLSRRESAPVLKSESPVHRKLESPTAVVGEGRRPSASGEAPSPSVSEEHSTTAMTNVTPLSEQPPPSPPARGPFPSTAVADKAGAARITLPSLSWAPPPLRTSDSHGSAVTTSSAGAPALTSGRTPSPPTIGGPVSRDGSLTLPPLSAGSADGAGRQRLPSVHSSPTSAA